MHPAEPGKFQIEGGGIRLPGGATIRINEGDLIVTRDSSGLMGWYARLHFDPDDYISQVLLMGKELDVTLIGTAFRWRGKALVNFLRPLEADAEVQGTGALEWEPL